MHPFPQLQPFDEFNQELVRQVRPSEWSNPTPSGRYNLVVIGGGTAGLVTAAGAAGLGAKVALIERGLLGGDCLNSGCVPSKALIRCARGIREIRKSPNFGTAVSEVQVDFASIMKRMRRLRAEISPHDSAERFRRLGVDVFFGSGQFLDSHKISVGEHRLRFKKAVIATGSKAAIPDIPGLSSVRFLTNETIFSLIELPQSIAIIGGGPIGCELAQTFSQFGTRVTLIARSTIMSREEPEAIETLSSALVSEGIRFLNDTIVEHVSAEGRKKKVLYKCGGKQKELHVDEILVAVGRTPNIDGMNLELVGVQANLNDGIIVNDRLQSTNGNIYAAGDVCSQFKFTHAADFMARIVIQNSLFYGRARASRLIIPRCTYTSPEIAQVGMTVEEAKKKGLETDVYFHPMSQVDRAILDGDTAGFAKVVCRKGRDKIVGATIVAEHAGEMIGELTMAIKHGIGLRKIAAVIHPYPTQAEVIRKLGDQYNRTRLKPWIKQLFERWLAWQRS